MNYRNLDRLGQIADQVTLMDMLNGQVSPEAIRDRIVLIGTTASSYRDHWLTPYSPTEGKTKGVFMQAQMTSHLLSAVLDNRPLLKTWPEWQEMLWISVWAAVGSALMFTLGRPLLTDSVQQSPSTQRPRQRSPAAVKLFLGLLLSELGLFGLCWLLFSQKTVWVPWVPAAIAPIAVASSAPLTRRFSQRFFDSRSSSITQKTTD
ncbi:MAG: CHASE2 domain-containing protein [Cyanobacteria bacterium J06635_11]